MCIRDRDCKNLVIFIGDNNILEYEIEKRFEKVWMIELCSHFSQRDIACLGAG